METMASRGILTLAFGKPKFIEMAKALAWSLNLHAPAIPRAIVTDSNDAELAQLFSQRIDYRPQYGSNVRQKMYLDQYSPFDETLFIDSDSLVVRGLDSFWIAFAAVPFGTSGDRLLRSGETDAFLDVDFILKHFGFDSLPKFNGGIYYFKRNAESAALFATARDLMARSAELKFKEFRNDGPNDEALYSVAMAIRGLKLIDMGNAGMWTPINAESPLTVDIPRGICTFQKKGRQVTPDIIHFAGFTGSFIYLRECSKLKSLAHGKGGALSPGEAMTLRVEAAKAWRQETSATLRRRIKKIVNAG
jgi:hypothetical protein